MEYLLAIYGDEKAMMSLSEAEMAPVMEAWHKYDSDVRQGVKVLAANALQPTTTATTVRGKNGQAITSDGPFAETKEQLGGFYLIDAADLDEAIEWAGKMPNVAGGGAVEVRPIQRFD